MSSTDWRELCEELASWIERSTRHYIQDPEVLIRARAALARPEPEVSELTAALRNEATNCTCTLLTSGDLRCIADLLERQP